MPRRHQRRFHRLLKGQETLERRLVMTGAPIINEFLASNASTLVDEDGDTSDWFEVYNPTTDVIDLKGWYVTDDPAQRQKWEFPAATLGPGEYLVVFASNKDRATAGREMHTNFKLAAGSESLLLVEPDGVTISSSFDPYPTQREDISYGISQSTDTVLPVGAEVTYLVPRSEHAALGAGWTASDFDDSAWQTGPAGLGFGVLEPGFSVRHLDVNGGDNGTIDNVAEATQILSGQFDPSDYVLVEERGDIQQLDFGGSLGTFLDTTNSYLIPNSTVHFLVEARATVTIPEGEWTIALGSNEGGFVRLEDVTLFGESNTDGDTPGDNEIRYAGTRAHGWTSGQFTVGPGGLTTQFAALMFERGGADSFEVAIRAGHHDNQVDMEDWALLQDGALGWTVVHESALAQTDLQPAMLDVNASLWVRTEFDIDDPAQLDSLRLQLRYNDGFVAYINGQEVVRSNAPNDLAWNATATAKRSLRDSAKVVSVNLSEHLEKLQAGSNVLAVHGLNVSAADEDFLLEPVLATAGTQSVERFFLEPSPGQPNGEGVLGFVSDVQVSQQRGFFTESFSLEFSTLTPAATIRYTTDSSTPKEDSGIVYDGPITISSTSTLRVAAFKDGFDPSVTETHTYIFLEDVLDQDATPPSTFPTRAVNSQIFNYGMDPQIVNSARWGPQMIGALTALPSISIVTDSNHLFDSRRGIYVNARNRGSGWERPASLELIDPAEGSQFQIDAGLRIRGGFSRSGNNPKHAFRAFFRDEYGDKKLAYALFGDEGVDEFDNIDFRTAQNYSWSFQGDGRNTMLREVFSRDTQRAMGQPYTRSRHYHLYLNGQYWGIYMTQERAEASYAESYFDGDKEDYDVIKHGGSSGIEATDGNTRAYRRLWQASRAGFASNEAYFRIQGMNPDGTRNLDFERLLDASSLIDYMITAYFVGDRDGPGSRFTQPRPNNFYGIYNRENPDGFKWFMHDAEHSLGTGVTDLVNPLTIDHNGFSEGNFSFFNPQWLHEKLVENAEYRRQLSDRVHELFENDGVLSVNNALARVDARAAAIETAIIAESARWGDSRREPAYDKDDWQVAVEGVRNFIRGRHATVIRQFERRGWFPATDPVSFTVDGSVQHGGQIEPSSSILLSTTGTADEVVLRVGSRWRYLDDGSDQGSGWRDPDFDHSSWKAGSAELGYGDGDERAIVDFGGDASDKHITTYFRRSMTVRDLDTISHVVLSLKRDDGAIVYINGQEVLRSNMPGGAVHYRTRSASTIGGADESTFHEFQIDASALVEGSNLIAAEIHQTSPTSSDISFDLEVRVARAGSTTSDILYTTDGSDPRLLGGEVAPGAVLYQDEEIRFDESTVLSARTLEDGQWGVLSRARFAINAFAQTGNLAITEVNYNPHPAMPEFGEAANNDADDHEFVELQNISDQTIELGGLRFTEGIRFNFADQVLGPGQRIVIPRDKETFAARYGTDILLAAGDDGEGKDGVFDGKLSNGGELLRLEDADGNVIQELTFSDDAPWPSLADGDGSSLEIVDVHQEANDPYNWRPSGRIGGSPGTSGGPLVQEVVINEILTHSGAPIVDAIELRNTTDLPIDVSGWYLTDAGSDLRQFRIPNGSVIAGGEYLVLSENQLGFGFRGQEADNAFFVQADGNGKPIFFSDYVEFGATQDGTTLGRWPESTGDLFPMSSPTLGDDNAGPHLPEVAITEVHYQPSSTAAPVLHEFIEVSNRGASPLDVGDWQLDGAVQFTFPAGTAIVVGESLVLVSFDASSHPELATTFRETYSIGDQVRLLGPYGDADRPNPDSLRDAGETIVLQRPEDVNQIGLGYVLVDRVTYDDEPPWPEAAGSGDSLHRIPSIGYGDLPGSWRAAPPTPGSAVTVNVPGDFDGNQRIDADDIDLIASAIRTNSATVVHDLDGNGTVDRDDFDFLITEILDTRHGDTDLNGKVEFADFLALAANFGKVQQGWAMGNFGVDAETGFADFLLLSTNFGFVRADAADLAMGAISAAISENATSPASLALRDDLFGDEEVDWS